MGRFSRKFGGVIMPTPEAQQTTSAEEKNVEANQNAKEDVYDVTGGIGMGGALDDVQWFEQMAELTGGEAKAPGKGQKKEKK
jgi:hypothetical protein